MSLLDMTCRPVRGGVLVTVSGELDATNTHRLASAIRDAHRPGHSLILDLSGLAFMDSSGLHVLVRAHDDVREQGGTLHLAAVRDIPARILQITGVWDALTIHADVDEAVMAVREAQADRRPDDAERL
ncbi:STAS domain-containing protein [Nonomuraea spiralis]|uniref:Anti-sigma factor antagonist n=1 Tax=Nonomuraea spiralis TaxID=46182 RepID=A0ABV5I9Z2_9ACTN|nr:STAS domain-containing protein [Nonomuraea spiralis]GGT05805.1 anti-sigma factor antagonist [Nonomuraea spiralis]